MKRVLMACLLVFLLISRAHAEPVGMVEDLLSGEHSGWGESPLGDAVADAIAVGTGADVVVLPAQAIRGNLRGGQVSDTEVLRAVDDKMVLAVAEVDLITLELLLEDGLTRLTMTEAEKLDAQASDFERFPQISGFRLEVNVPGLVGERVWRITLPEHLGETVTVCSAQGWLEELGIPCQQVEGTPATYAMAYIAQGGLSSGVESGRIRMLGTMDDDFMEGIPPIVVFVVLGIILVFAVGYVRVNGRPASKRYGTR